MITPGGPWINATSREAIANLMASFCESFRLGSIHSVFSISSVLSWTGDGDDKPNNTRKNEEYDASGIFCSLPIVWFIL